MKTISMQDSSVSGLSANPGLLVIQHPFTARGAVATWLPAPPVRRATPAVKPRSVSRSIWLPAEGQSLVEKSLWMLLVVAAAAAIGYGFSCLISLVQNWAGITATVGHMVQ